MTRERRFSLAGAAALLVALPLIASGQTTPATPKIFFACYGSLTGVVYRIKEPGLPAGCLHRTHVEFSWTSGAGGDAALTDHGALQGLGEDDHPQYLLIDGSRALTGGLSVGGNKLINLAAATADGEAVRYEQAVKTGDAAGGDLSGTYPAPTVAKLQNTAVSAAAPAIGQVLAFDGSAWKPAAAPDGGGGISGWEIVSRTTSGFGTIHIAVGCPAGKKSLSGGFTLTSGRLVRSSPIDGGWLVSAQSEGEQEASFSAHALCADAAP